MFFIFFFSSRRRHTRFDCDWSQTCALPILGHATLEQALEARQGITCKVIFAPAQADGGADPDSHAEAWLSALPQQATPRDMPPLPIFGYPGWLTASASADFYDDERHFRPRRAIK